MANIIIVLIALIISLLYIHILIIGTIRIRPNVKYAVLLSKQKKYMAFS
jgi:hypothetical protein